MGTVSKKQKAVREKERRQLTGEAGKLLYLEALQLLLRKQLLWLIKEKGHREELETVVRDLWDLRIRGATALSQGAASGAASEEVLEVFSSQPTVVESTQLWSSRSKAQDWSAERGLSWPTPSMGDTLALCYLGCYLLRIPTRLGELIKWANDFTFPYRHSVCLNHLTERCRWHRRAMTNKKFSSSNYPLRCKIECHRFTSRYSRHPYDLPWRVLKYTQQSWT